MSTGTRLLGTGGKVTEKPVRAALWILRFSFMTLLAVILLSQLLQIVRCGEKLGCLQPHDTFLALALVFTVTLAVTSYRPQGWLLRLAEIGWAALFTWYGWFSLESPFRVHELQSASFSPMSAYAGRVCLYLVLVALGIFPAVEAFLASTSRPGTSGR